MKPTLLFATAILSGCASAAGLSDFRTDGCSLFPDRAEGKDWCLCCVRHDVAYWRGGSSDERLAADRELRACVARSTGSDALARTMFAGVRAGGSPWLPTSWRWGFGWPFGRGYEPLTPEERADAARKEEAYVAQHGGMRCPDRGM